MNSETGKLRGPAYTLVGRLMMKLSLTISVGIVPASIFLINHRTSITPWSASSTCSSSSVKVVGTLRIMPLEPVNDFGREHVAFLQANEVRAKRFPIWSLFAGVMNRSLPLATFESRGSPTASLIAKQILLSSASFICLKFDLSSLMWIITGGKLSYRLGLVKEGMSSSERSRSLFFVLVDCW